MRAAFLVSMAAVGFVGVIGAQRSAPAFSSQSLFAVSGVVKEEATGRPLRGATVSIDDLHRRTITDPTGHYRFDSLAHRDYTVSARMIGYVIERRELHASCTVAVIDQQGRTLTPGRCTPTEDSLSFYMRPERHID